MNEYGTIAGFAHNASQSQYPHLWRGLIGLWVPSAGNTGGQLVDYSPNNNWCWENTTPPSWVPGRRGLAASFPAAGAAWVCNNTSITNGLSAMTFMCWVKQNTLDVTAGFFTKGPSAATNAIFMETFSDGMMYFENNNGSNQYTFFDYSTAVSANVWFHVAGVFDGSLANNSRLKIYINGRLMTTTSTAAVPATLPTNTSNFYLGIYGGSSQWNGLLDDMRLYNRALTAREIWQSYTMPSPLVRSPEVYGRAAAVVGVGQPTMRRWGGVPQLPGGQLVGRTW
jgi:concanavalin A-like lectin/glucanase superfamily protein